MCGDEDKCVLATVTLLTPNASEALKVLIVIRWASIEYYKTENRPVG